MDESHQDKIRNRRVATENGLWLPPLSPEDQKKLDLLRKKPFAQRMGIAGKTPWDLIQLLLIPLVLAGIGFWFNVQLNRTSLQASERQHSSDVQIAADNRKADLKRQQDQQRESTLETYLEDMKDLLLNRGLKVSKSGDEVREVARVETLSVLRQLDPARKEILLKFLYEAQLIARKDTIIILKDADFSNVYLEDRHLSGILLMGTNLSGAYFLKAWIFDAHLNGADLSSADFRGAYLADAHLTAARLSNARLGGAYLNDADLRGADLSGAYLGGARLNGANLTGAIVTNQQLAEAETLQGAIMPDGSVHP
jgi:Pentapeptide repeats (8 copies)